MENCSNNCTNSTMNRVYGNSFRNYSGRNMSDKPYGRTSHSHDTCNHIMHDHETSMDNFPLGMAYVPWQTWKNIYEPDKALQRGTIFEELDKPFYGSQGVKR